MRGPRLRALGLWTGWGRGAEAVPADSRRAAAGRGVVGLGPAPLDGERFRRSTRECRWGLAAVGAMLEDGGAGREAIAGERTALVYVSAAAYAASNRSFIEGRGGGTHFAYTAPAVLSAEAAIEYGILGPSAIFLGGPPATLRAIWHAATLLAEGACEQALVLAVETFEECADLYQRARRLTGTPLVEAAACLWLEPGAGTLALGAGAPGQGTGVQTVLQAGQTLAVEPLVALALWRARGGHGGLRLAGAWPGDAASLQWTEVQAPATAPVAPAGNP